MLGAEGHELVGVDLVVQFTGLAQRADGAQAEHGVEFAHTGCGLRGEGDEQNVLDAAELLNGAVTLRDVAAHTGADHRAGNGNDKLGLDTDRAVVGDDDLRAEVVLIVRGAGRQCGRPCKQRCCCEGKCFHFLHFVFVDVVNN